MLERIVGRLISMIGVIVLGLTLRLLVEDVRSQILVLFAVLGALILYIGGIIIGNSD